jgi:hypothetical protein
MDFSYSLSPENAGVSANLQNAKHQAKINETLLFGVFASQR